MWRKNKAKREPWGDPKWHMRRTVMIATLAFCGVLLLLGFVVDPAKTDAVGRLSGSLSWIVTPVLLAYLGITESSAVFRELKGLNPPPKEAGQ